jgi:hypothetical protein
MLRLLLTAIYYLFFVPVPALVRLFQDPLRRRWEPERASYWSFDGGAPVPAPADRREESSPAGRRAAAR